MNKTLLNKIRIYTQQDPRGRFLNKYIISENGSIFFSDSYSIIKLFDTGYNRKNRSTILDSLKKADLYDTILNLYKGFEKDGYNIPVEKDTERTTEEDFYIKNKNDYCFNIEKINRIKKIISSNGNINITQSENNKTTICLCGDRGVAYLLGCIIL